jgi:Raf kinase inhibitor-like YbhB/YbcL family protein
MAFEMRSGAFSEGAVMPSRFTCDGKDVSPALSWAGVPVGTNSFALICDDPDAPAGTWVHWVIFNISPKKTGLPQGVPAVRELNDGTRQGVNSFRRIGYGGPCPPRGPAHRYFFKLYALDRILDLKPGVTRQDLLRAMKGHILGDTKLMGRYRR